MKNKILYGSILIILIIVIVIFKLYEKPPLEIMVDTSLPTKTALMAGGCFWCVEADFEKAIGVVKVVSGYTGGSTENPTYKNYAESGHREVVEITYVPEIISYGKLVEYLIKHSDVTDGQGSFYDRGLEYSSAIYYETEEEKNEALKIISEIDARKIYDKPIDLAVIARTDFWPAEEYHQDYYKKNPVKYNYYRKASGRDDFIKKYWGEENLRTHLTPLQYKVTQENGTEKPFENEYDKNTADGIYVDIVSGEVLYSSKDKYDSGTGWPSFVKPIHPDAVVLKEDISILGKRVEVRSKYANSHLGHVFDDGPTKRGGKRYCMNSAALRFIPKDAVEKEGYGKYLSSI